MWNKDCGWRRHFSLETHKVFRSLQTIPKPGFKKHIPKTARTPKGLGPPKSASPPLSECPGAKTVTFAELGALGVKQGALMCPVSFSTSHVVSTCNLNAASSR